MRMGNELILLTLKKVFNRLIFDNALNVLAGVKNTIKSLVFIQRYFSFL